MEISLEETKKIFLKTEKRETKLNTSWSWKRHLRAIYCHKVMRMTMDGLHEIQTRKKLRRFLNFKSG